MPTTATQDPELHLHQPPVCRPSPIVDTIRLMAKRGKAWYDRKWVPTILAILSLVSGLFREDIRGAVTGLPLFQVDWFYDILMAVGVIGLVLVLMLKSDRAARTCEDLREQLQKDLAKHRKNLNEDLASHREELQKNLVALVDSRLKPVADGVGTLDSNLSAFGNRLGALDSRITALADVVARSTSKL